MRSATLPVAVSLALTLGLALTAASCGSGGSAGSGGTPTWHEGEVHDRWRVVYTGYGTVTGNGDEVTLAPAVSTEAGMTHGALVVAQSAPTDVALSAKLTTRQQLRNPGPNPWEVGWLLWCYQDPDHFYALVLKPNGWELSKQDPAYPGNQRFLASGSSPTFPVGREYAVDIVHVGQTAAVRVDGHALTTVTDTERPYAAGGVGLYTEDAVVHVTVTNIAAATGLPTWAKPAAVGATGAS